MILKQKEIFNKLAEERIEKITELKKRANPDKLIYEHKGPNADAKFNEFDNALSLINKIREGKIS